MSHKHLVLKMLQKKYFLFLNKWYPELKEQNKNAIKLFVGNKIDLRDN